jgi:hypothetical protein
MTKITKSKLSPFFIGSYRLVRPYGGFDIWILEFEIV